MNYKKFKYDRDKASHRGTKGFEDTMNIICLSQRRKAH